MSLIVPTRRGLLGGLLGLVAAPAVVKADSIMRVVAWKPPLPVVNEVMSGWLECNGALIDRAAYPELFAALGTHYARDLDRAILPDFRGKDMAGRIHRTDEIFTGPQRFVHIINARNWNGMVAGQIMPYIRHGISPSGRALAHEMATAIRSM